MGVAAPACAQGGGVVIMDDGAVTFKGGSISNSTAAGVRAPSASRASARGGIVCCAVRHGRWMARTVRRTQAAASGLHRCVLHRCIGARYRLHRRALHRRALHRFGLHRLVVHVANA
jgi:hypothetical protein